MRNLIFLALIAAVIHSAGAVGPLQIDNQPAVSIYRDFDDGLFGRSLYRGVIFSVKQNSFSRYQTLPVPEQEGLTAYLVTSERAEAFALGQGVSIEGAAASASFRRAAEQWLYRYSQNGIDILFSLEEAPQDLYDEIKRTYPENQSVAELVADSYKNGYVIRIHEAENVYRPQFDWVDYEDILISAALVADRFQPLWGIHDGNALMR